MANGNDDMRELRDAVYGSLIDIIRTDKYPSATMMDLFEAGADREQLNAYAAVLLDKVNGDRFPSMSMLRRLTRLV